MMSNHMGEARRRKERVVGLRVKKTLVFVLMMGVWSIIYALNCPKGDTEEDCPCKGPKCSDKYCSSDEREVCASCSTVMPLTSCNNFPNCGYCGNCCTHQSGMYPCSHSGCGMFTIRRGSCASCHDICNVEGCWSATHCTTCYGGSHGN